MKLLSCLILTAALAFGQASAEVQLKAAMHKEQVEGDLKGAIEQYRKLAAQFAKQPDVASRALYRLGQCQEKLGQAEARKAYERIVKEYGTQAVAAQARARLAAMSGGREPGSGLVARRIWTGEDRNYGREMISSDGRYAFFYEKNAIHLHELASGQTRQVSEAVRQGDSLGDALISPDGNEIVHARQGPDPAVELCFHNIDGTQARRLRLDKGASVRLWSWSPDGKNLLASLNRREGEKRSSTGVLLAVADGSARVLPWNPYGGRFSPDGRQVVFFRPARQGEGDLMLASLDSPQATGLVENAGFNWRPVWAPSGDRVLFISDRRENAELWSIRVLNGRAGGPAELVRQDAGTWDTVGMTRNGDYYYMSHSYTGDLYQVEVDPASGRAASQPVRLTSRNTTFAPAWSPNGEWLAYYREPGMPRGSYRSLVLRSTRGGEERVVTPRNPRQTRPLLQWFPDGRAVVIDVRSALFRLDIESGEDRPLVPEDGIERIKSLAPDGRAAFYSDPTSGGAGSRILRRDLASGEERELAALGAGRARGVSVSPDGSRLAFLARFGDELALMTMPAGGGEPRQLYRSRDLSFTMWGSYTTWDKAGRRVFFTAREGEGGHEDIFSVPAEGGPAQPVGAVRNRVGGISVHPDGRRIAYIERQWRSEFWVLKNLAEPAR